MLVRQQIRRASKHVHFPPLGVDFHVCHVKGVNRHPLHPLVEPPRGDIYSMAICRVSYEPVAAGVLRMLQPGAAGRGSNRGEVRHDEPA